MGGALVFGAGRVGRSVASALRAHGPVEVLTRSTHPPLGAPGPEACRIIREAAARTGATTAVNTVGRLTGTAEELDEANHRWVAWLVDQGLTGLDLRLVHVGSAAEYGDPGSTDPIPESQLPAPTSDYGRTKWAGSAAVLSSPLPTTVVRAFNLVGPEPAPSSPLHQFATDIAALPPDGGEVVVWDADTVRDFVLLDDLVAAVEVATTTGAPGLVNVCTGVGLRFADIVTALGEAQGKPVEVRSLGEPGIGAVVGDPGRVTALLGRRPTMSVRSLAAATVTPAPCR